MADFFVEVLPVPGVSPPPSDAGVLGNMYIYIIYIYIWAIYNDLSRGHPKWCFSKGIPPKMALN